MFFEHAAIQGGSPSVASSPIVRPRGTTDQRRTTATSNSSSHHHGSAPPRLQLLICIGAETSHPVHGPPKLRAAETTPWNEVTFLPFSRVSSQWHNLYQTVDHNDTIDWFWKSGWLNHKNTLCTRIVLLPQLEQNAYGVSTNSRLVRSIESQNQSICKQKKPAKNMVEVELRGGWGPRPSASAHHRQSGWGLHQRGWSNDACATPQWRLHHELAWIWTDFLSEQRRATDFVETPDRGGGKRKPARCSRKTQDKFAMAFMTKKLLHRCIGAHASVHVHFLRRVCIHFDRCCEHHACAGMYVRQVLWTSAYTFAYTLATGCAYALMYMQFVHSALGNEDGGVQLVYEGTCCLAWGGGYRDSLLETVRESPTIGYQGVPRWAQ